MNCNIFHNGNNLYIYIYIYKIEHLPVYHVSVYIHLEIDYPPMANAGSNIILNLPHNSITLNGNASTDDHGVELYEWIKQSDDRLTADMTVSRGRCCG